MRVTCLIQKLSNTIVYTMSSQIVLQFSYLLVSLRLAKFFPGDSHFLKYLCHTTCVSATVIGHISLAPFMDVHFAHCKNN